MILTRVSLIAWFELDEFLEGLLELVIEDGVDDRVDERVQVTEPGEDVEEHRVEAVLADGHDQRCHEEWQPADDKCAQDDAQCLGGLLLAGST